MEWLKVRGQVERGGNHKHHLSPVQRLGRGWALRSPARTQGLQVLSRRGGLGPRRRRLQSVSSEAAGRCEITSTVTVPRGPAPGSSAGICRLDLHLPLPWPESPSCLRAHGTAVTRYVVEAPTGGSWP